jgi:hypothetical protein
MIEISVEQSQLTALTARLAHEADGKRLRLELAANLRAAVAPAVSEIKAGAQNIKRGSSSAKRSTKKHPVAESDISIGAAIARGTSARTRLSGRMAGVSVRIGKSGMPRGFRNAPKRFNAPKFRHPVYGNREVWVSQVGAPGFFDIPLYRGRPVYRAACVKAMDDMSRRIAR